MKTPPITAPTLEDMEALAMAALETIPAVLRQHVTGVVIRIADFPELDIDAEFGLESPFDLLGLYQGVSLDQKTMGDPSPEVDMVFLYRRPILDYWCETGEDLAAIVRHVLIHEIGHHFGFSDDDMDALENAESG
ncbi:MAG: metallopeptidase family protein [Magnetospiraceae bacterium]